jgi:hypothetical protein
VESPPDIVLLSADRLTRAPLRAQLIEDGFAVIATDTWPAMREHLRPGAKPRLAIVDLQGLEHPADVLDGLRVLMPPSSVLVIGAAGTVPPDDLVRAGFVAVARPVSIAEIVGTASEALQRTNR